jgi:hypothetical protein
MGSSFVEKISGKLPTEKKLAPKNTKNGLGGYPGWLGLAGLGQKGCKPFLAHNLYSTANFDLGIVPKYSQSNSASEYI